MMPLTYNKLLLTTVFLSFTIITSKTLNETDHNIEFASKDYGGMFHNVPAKVIYPKSVDDVAFIVSGLYKKGKLNGNYVKIAARGNGHSIQGQAQALGGVVINMQSLKTPGMYFGTTKGNAYVDVSGGELWIDVLNESLKHGLAPLSWTDYLYLTIGGTLSNGGLSGQAFRHGPQIDNVLQLEIVSGKGEIKNCSAKENYGLFYAALGGLGQFGIITKARIALGLAPSRVKYITAVYREFTTMSRDQELLIASRTTFDYVEGFVLIQNTSTRERLNYWGSSYKLDDSMPTSVRNSKTHYLIELAKYYLPSQSHIIDEEINEYLQKLSYCKPTLNILDLSYVEFLDRVHTSELDLRKKGLWEIPHPWLNLLVPKRSVDKFVEEVFENIVIEPVNGPILIYPINKYKWNSRTSLVTPPNDDVFYLVAFLSAAVPSSDGTNPELQRLLDLNKKILDFCQQANLGVKEYLPHYTTHEEWSAHFGDRWVNIVKTKRLYDPFALLAPGQQIFTNGTAF